MCLLNPSARAALLAYEPFDYPAGEDIFTKNGGSGWTSSWTYMSSRPGTISSPGLSHPSLATLGNALQTPAVSVSTEPAVFVRGLPTFGADDTTLYLSFLLRPDASYGYYGGVNLGGLFIGKSGGVSDTTYGLEGPLGDVVKSDTDVVTGTTVWLVVRAQFKAGHDLFELFVNPPTSGLPPVPSATKSNHDAGTADYFLVNNAGGFTTDEIRIGTSYADVAPVPEPAACAAGLGLTALWAVHRARRREAASL